MPPVRKISMRGFAEVTSAAPARKAAALNKYKFPDSAESVGRSNYYIKALSAIKRHHRGDHAYVNQVLHELATGAAIETDARKRAKLAGNHRAITAYLKYFGTRQLTIRTGRQLSFAYKELLVSAKPDIVAEEHGQLLLIKLNLGQNAYSGGVVSMMLHMLYETGRQQFNTLSPRAVECIQVSSGSRIQGPRKGFPSASVLKNACEEVLNIWTAA